MDHNFLDWDKKEQKSLLESIKRNIPRLGIEVKYYLVGSRCGWANEDSDIDIMIIFKYKDRFKKPHCQNRGEFRWKCVRVFWVIRQDHRKGKKDCYRYWKGYHLPMIDLENQKYYKGKDLDRYLLFYQKLP